ncbi:MAG: peroxidase, partial [Bacteroidota bacterium]
VSTPPENHRVVRRAMPYGPPFDPTKEDNTPRGLIGHFVGIIENAFEFLMHNWVNESIFAPDIDFISKDPLLGANNAADSIMNIPKKPFAAPENIKGFPRFIQTKGSAYLFLPGIDALKFIGKQG